MDLGNLGNLFGEATKAASSVKEALNSAAGIAKSTGIKGAADENTRNAAFKQICALIPGKVDNNVLIGAFETMRKQQKMMKKDFSANLSGNKTAFKAHEASIKKAGGFIDDQNNYTDLKYGEATVQTSGCGIIATYNALYNVNGNGNVTLPSLIDSYEKDGIILSGKFGTSPKAIKDLLDAKGYKTELSTKETDFDRIGREYTSMIMMIYNDKNDISQEVHTINIAKTGGKFTGHNVYCNGSLVGPYASVSEVVSHINNGKGKGIVIIGVKK